MATKGTINAEKIDLSAAIPPNATAVTIRYAVTPASAAVLIYASPTTDPVQVSGEGDVEITIREPQTIYVRRTASVKDLALSVPGWRF